MNKLSIAFSALAFVTLSTSLQTPNSVSAQTRCNLTEATAPSVRGLRLGLTTQQFLALFPGITKKRDMKDTIERLKSTEVEPVYIGFDPIAGGDAQQFAGIGSVAATVYKGRVVDFNVQYDGATWRNVDEWIAKLSESFTLPRSQEWVVGPNESPNKVVRCDAVMIEAAIQGGSASLRVQHTGYLREIEDRARAAEEKRRQEIKP